MDRLEGIAPTRICLTEIDTGDTRVVTFGPHTDRCPNFHRMDIRSRIYPIAIRRRLSTLLTRCFNRRFPIAALRHRMD